MEHQADRECLVQEQDALRAQRLAEFQSLAFDASDLAEEVERRPSGLPIRNCRLPQCYRDDPPAVLIPIPTPIVVEELESSYTGELNNHAPADDINMEPTDSDTGNFSSAHSPPYVCTQPDGNDLFRQYQGCYPSYDPENSTILEHLCDGPTFQRSQDSDIHLAKPRTSYFAPFLNATVWRLMGWFYNGSTQKSLDDLNHLVHDVILAEDFDCKDLHNFSAHRETRRLDEAPQDPSSSFFASDGWHTTSIPIRLPCEKVKQLEATAPEFWVEGLHYRKITDIVRSAFEEPAAQTFHTVPYKLFWQPDKTRTPERVITEVYTSDAMLREHERVRNSPNVPGCNLETVIAAIMLWSDSTHLASFGNAALWPIYLFLGNQSKYVRAKPTSFAAHHLAYIPKACIYYSLYML
ncbi:hypothetical protein EDD17DRAFT_1683582 [Pisolithus thermaeus]|nr:hypothetical protein EDD17DRAFT_1683582 [Pisolithus thermaeus]